MARPIVKAELVFSPDATASGSVAYFPGNPGTWDDKTAGLVEQVDEWLWVVEYGAASSAGKVQFQTATASNYAGTWANVGNTVDWAAATTQKYVQNSGVFSALRCQITTTVTSGTVRVFVIGVGSTNP